ncbi:MAG: hypothetical protein QXS79_06775 [Candidatus Bathyarchaeia archaeon]
MSLNSFLRGLGATPALQVPALEEQEEEPTVSLETKDTLHVCDVDIDIINREATYPRFFVDGVERIAVTHYVNIPGYPRIPVVGAHIIVGAGEFRDGNIIFHACREAFIIIFPYQTITSVLKVTGAPVPHIVPQSFMSILDSTGGFYDKVRQRSLGHPMPTFFCDSTLDFQGKVSISESDLIASGKVVNVARNRVDGIRRALELGLAVEIRNRTDEYVAVDGPLADKPFLMYGRLASDSIKRDLGDLRRKFDLLKRLIGLVKSVEIVPQKGLASVFQRNFRVTIHKFKDSDIGWHFLACFTILRPELTSLLRGAPQATGGLVRVDVPLPAVMDSYDPSWHDVNYMTINRRELERLLRGVLRLRVPIPHDASSYRFLTEVYPIHEVENYLHARLMSKDMIRAYAWIL